MIDTSIDTFAEAEYFADLVMVLASIAEEDSDSTSLSPEFHAHQIMDKHTHDGVLDTEAIDAYIDQLIGV